MKLFSVFNRKKMTETEKLQYALNEFGILENYVSPSKSEAKKANESDRQLQQELMEKINALE